MEAAGRFVGDGAGYFREQATRPQTVSYALADSPVGQAMWLYEKFQAWTDNKGDPEDALAVDQMLDDITLYWLTDTAASSARIYWQNSQGKPAGFSAGRIELPMAATIFPKEIYRAPKAWAEAVWPNLIYWNEVDRGGHIAIGLLRPLDILRNGRPVLAAPSQTTGIADDVDGTAFMD